ncbi:MAG: hypothetical protein ACHQLQ_04265 [Candidatus Acidiferrales bacterium]
MGEKKASGISRREFARRAAMASAAASFAPVGVLAAESAAASPEPQQPSDMAKLSPEGQVEVEARIHAILSQYGSRFSEAQKADIRRLCALAQPPLDRLRAYALENGDGPALYLKPLVEREKKPASSPSAAKPVAPAKKN